MGIPEKSEMMAILGQNSVRCKLLWIKNVYNKLRSLNILVVKFHTKMQKIFNKNEHNLLKYLEF